MDDSELLTFVAFGVLGSAMCYGPVFYVGLGLYLHDRLQQKKVSASALLWVPLFLALTCWFGVVLLAGFYVITDGLLGAWVCFACLIALLLKRALKPTV